MWSASSSNRVRTDPEEGGGVGRGHCRSNREKRRAIHSLSETERKLGGGGGVRIVR